VDLQLAYLAAPQSAAQASAAQSAPLSGQLAAQAAFAAQVHQREETIEETTHSERSPAIRTDPDGRGNHGQTPQKRQQTPYEEQAEGSVLGLSADGEHFIDVTA
jgi:hypothetical protein